MHSTKIFCTFWTEIQPWKMKYGRSLNKMADFYLVPQGMVYVIICHWSDHSIKFVHISAQTMCLSRPLLSLRGATSPARSTTWHPRPLTHSSRPTGTCWPCSTPHGVVTASGPSQASRKQQTSSRRCQTGKWPPSTALWKRVSESVLFNSFIPECWSFTKLESLYHCTN